MYPDRVEIRNPGGLFGPVTEDGLGEDPMSSSRNASLLKLLEEVPIPGTDRVVCENRGTGIRTEWIRSLADVGLTDAQCLGLAMLRNGDVLDNKAYRSASNLDSRQATAELGDLVARGLVEQAGVRRWARYELAPDLAEDPRPGAPLPARRDRRPDVIRALGDGEMSRAAVATTLDLPDKTLARWLRIMRKEGSVELVGGAQ